MNYQQQANDLAKFGRYGDTMLVHMNPYEVQGLASLSPTGQLTTNPVTGQPEAFLPFLAPLIGSALGTTFLGGTLGTAAAGAIGSGLATALQSRASGASGRDALKEGLLSGIMGYGLGKAFGAGKEAFQATGQTAGELAAGAVGPPVPVPTATMGERLIAGGKAGIEALADPKTFLPMSVAGGTLGQMQSQREFEKQLREQEAGLSESERTQMERSREIMRRALAQARERNPQYTYRDFVSFKQGGITKLPYEMKKGGEFPDLNKDGKVTYADVLQGRGVEMQEGGMTERETPVGTMMVSDGGIGNMPFFDEVYRDHPYYEPSMEPDDRILDLTIRAIQGEDINKGDVIIEEFINRYGQETFESLRNQILNSIMAEQQGIMTADAQTEGMIQGEGGGMDDQVMGMIGTQQPVAVSPGEYIVPADVVSGLGDGSSEAGARELDNMMDKVRMARTGGIMQPNKINKNEVMPV